jgi:hypothetical protein
MFGPRQGSWWLSSAKDKRWDKAWDDVPVLVTGGMPEYIEKHITAMTEKYGPPPDDLMIACHKY